jgi:uroporphyrinogen decarboxylase
MILNKGLRPDQMTFSERMQALIKGRPTDRVPFILFASLGFCARNTGYPLFELYNNPEKCLNAQLWTMEQYGFQINPVMGYASYGSWEFGGDVKLPQGEWEQAPKVLRFPVQTEDDVWKLQLPDIPTAGMLPQIMAFSLLLEKQGLPIPVHCGSPFTRAANICGIENLMRWMLRKPDLVHRILRLSTEHLIQMVEHWLRTFGAEKISLREGMPVESNQLISPKQLETFALPYEIELHQRIFGLGLKRFDLIHLCGEQNLNLPSWAKVPMGERSLISFGHEVDIDVAIQSLGKDCIIGGNINTSLLQAGRPEEVYEACHRAIEKGKLAPQGFALMPGCDIPSMAPSYNIFSMRKAVNDFGWY